MALNRVLNRVLFRGLTKGAVMSTAVYVQILSATTDGIGNISFTLSESVTWDGVTVPSSLQWFDAVGGTWIVPGAVSDAAGTVIGLTYNAEGRVPHAGDLWRLSSQPAGLTVTSGHKFENPQSGTTA